MERQKTRKARNITNIIDIVSNLKGNGQDVGHMNNHKCTKILLFKTVPEEKGKEARKRWKDEIKEIAGEK